MTSISIKAGAVLGVLALAATVTAPAMAAQTTATRAVKKYSAGQVAQHNTTSDCWTIIGRGVYDLTAYVPRHPGGPGEIASICGRNGTSAFSGEHRGQSSPKRVLKSYRIGKVKVG